jgi:dTDP-4-dehydrorhamnose reductase
VKILLLGATGQLGTCLRQTLQAVGHVAAVSRTGDSATLACNLTDLLALDRLLRREQPDLVVNAAAYTAVDNAESDAGTATRINADVPRIIGEAMARRRGAVVHYSTDYVFDGQGTRPYVETDAPSPISVYGRSKLEGELGLSETGADHLILRTAWVYSLHGRNFLTTMLRLAGERAELRIVDDQHGTPTSAHFLATATASMVSTWAGGASRRPSGIYHITAGGETTWHAFARQLFIEAVNVGRLAKAPTLVPIPTTDYPTPARRPPYSVLDLHRVVDTFGLVIPDWQSDLRQVMSLS